MRDIQKLKLETVVAEQRVRLSYHGPWVWSDATGGEVPEQGSELEASVDGAELCSHLPATLGPSLTLGEWLPSGGRKDSPTIPRLPASPSIAPVLIGHGTGTVYSRPRPSKLALPGEESVSRTFYPFNLTSIGQPRGNIGDRPHAFLSKSSKMSPALKRPHAIQYTGAGFFSQKGGHLGGRHQRVIGLIWQSPGLAFQGVVKLTFQRSFYQSCVLRRQVRVVISLREPFWKAEGGEGLKVNLSPVSVPMTRIVGPGGVYLTYPSRLRLHLIPYSKATRRRHLSASKAQFNGRKRADLGKSWTLRPSSVYLSAHPPFSGPFQYEPALLFQCLVRKPNKREQGSEPQQNEARDSGQPLRGRKQFGKMAATSHRKNIGALGAGTWKELLARTATTALVIKVPESTLGRRSMRQLRIHANKFPSLLRIFLWWYFFPTSLEYVSPPGFSVRASASETLHYSRARSWPPFCSILHSFQSLKETAVTGQGGIREPWPYASSTPSDLKRAPVLSHFPFPGPFPLPPPYRSTFGTEQAVVDGSPLPVIILLSSYFLLFNTQFNNPSLIRSRVYLAATVLSNEPATDSSYFPIFLQETEEGKKHVSSEHAESTAQILSITVYAATTPKETTN
ncbi:uncharacterized protein CLUP02_15333 [Colletotrichum lupini]|uniref:Uncharacterized protein n=1 Tax=Colletotrichum lupini TaxID=145971 RepID=A0A9Q8T614_9PEZI|nr:uncharacterized protein CLUP02_15333 [Colletotrichum lupini]UQC89802.1 hypothetical protein CLUP02_15333 [Colletotrichum lupini]